MVEADFQRFYQLDYRDRYRRGSGLTLRRVAALAKALPPESGFMSAVEDRPPVSEASAAVMDLWSLWAGGKPHPRWSQLKRAREKAEFDALLEEERAVAREMNKVFLQGREDRDL